MTRRQKLDHVARLRSNARALRKSGNDFAARLLERGAEQFEADHKLTRKRTVTWTDR